VVALLLVLSAPITAADLKPFGRGGWQQLRRAHAGAPLIVHFWGLTCAPCLTELPKWGRLLRERHGVDLVFVAADPEPQEPARVTARLAQAGLASGENWMFTDRFVERLQFEVDPTWAGELPLTILVSRGGEVTTTAGTADFAALRAWIKTETRR
jgi:thiol-disulfide isomerase/thioredoxin